MWPNERGEFLRELDATDEAYVRKKFALGGYTGWQVRAVNYWLEQRELQREADCSARQLSIAKQSAFWTMTRGIVSVLGVLLTLLIHWLATR